VAAGLVAARDDQGAAAGDEPDRAFEDAQLGRVDQVVLEVDRQQRGLDSGEGGGGGVVRGGLQGGEGGSCVHRGQGARDGLVEGPVGGLAGGCLLLALDGVAGHQEQHLGGGAEARGLLGVVAAEPGGVAADRVDDHPPPCAVAAGDLGRQR